MSVLTQVGLKPTQHTRWHMAANQAPAIYIILCLRNNDLRWYLRESIKMEYFKKDGETEKATVKVVEETNAAGIIQEIDETLRPKLGSYIIIVDGKMSYGSLTQAILGTSSKPEELYSCVKFLQYLDSHYHKVSKRCWLWKGIVYEYDPRHLPENIPSSFACPIYMIDQGYPIHCPTLVLAGTILEDIRNKLSDRKPRSKKPAQKQLSQ